ncbi:MAG: ATP-binding protein [Deltaproteobacteria bacterium]|nr:ATP-binding protein [Deltaproteobacteria bacterium]
METTTRSELKLPNDLNYLRIVRNYVADLGALAGLPQADIDQLVLAADEACTNTIEHAFEPGEKGSFTLRGEISPSTLTLSVQDQGLPFDPTLAPVYAQPMGKEIEEVSASGLGLFLIRQAVDELQWVHHGREGKELRLVKHRCQTDVTEALPPAEIAPFKEDEPLAPPQEYAIRRLRPEDGIRVAQCLYRTYGTSYPNEDLYYPERIASMNETGEMISVVAEDAAGQIVGHYALKRSGPEPVMESGQAVVAPAHRGRKLMERMRTFIEEEGKRVGLIGIFGEPVTSHIYSQRTIESFDSYPCGLSLGLAPRSIQFKKISSEPLAQRESCMIYFKHLTADPGPATVYLPPQHQEILRRIYAGIGAPPTFCSPEVARSKAAGPGKVAVSFSRSFGIGLIQVKEIGADTAVEILRARHDLCDLAGAEAVFLELPLAQTGTPALCTFAEEKGFFLSGIGPRFAPDGDVLRMQYLNSEIDTGLLKIYNPFGRELLAYIEKERARVGATD